MSIMGTGQHPAGRAYLGPRRYRGGALLEPARNGIVATQVGEDGSASSIIPFTAMAVAFLAATTYIAHHTTRHAATTAIYLVHMAYIVLSALNEVRPMWFYVPSGVLFVLSQPDYFLLNKLICKGMNAKMDGSFVASICETAAVGVVYLARRSITKGSWHDEYAVPRKRGHGKAHEDGGEPEVETTNTKRSRRGLGYGLND
ncbi:hypothetical protein FIBSPDRAFT_960718 [Athelia psychrophila]|uniref:Uncharacterized protein n=1 Tax=Athelia psychrophila TaxID=1759441 RepID=A0A166C5F7_9AGAM|nr:hypothetical protein FIBSPDRAFT_960718 [Fibularhizoctonia sp. CBS 109695]